MQPRILLRYAVVGVLVSGLLALPVVKREAELTPDKAIEKAETPKESHIEVKKTTDTKALADIEDTVKPAAPDPSLDESAKVEVREESLASSDKDEDSDELEPAAEEVERLKEGLEEEREKNEEEEEEKAKEEESEEVKEEEDDSKEVVDDSEEKAVEAADGSQEVIDDTQEDEETKEIVQALSEEQNIFQQAMLEKLLDDEKEKELSELTEDEKESSLEDGSEEPSDNWYPNTNSQESNSDSYYNYNDYMTYPALNYRRRRNTAIAERLRRDVVKRASEFGMSSMNEDKVASSRAKRDVPFDDDYLADVAEWLKESEDDDGDDYLSGLGYSRSDPDEEYPSEQYPSELELPEEEEELPPYNNAAFEEMLLEHDFIKPEEPEEVEENYNVGPSYGVYNPDDNLELDEENARPITFEGEPGIFVPVKRQMLSLMPGIKRSSTPFYPYEDEPEGRYSAFVPNEKRGVMEEYARLYRLARALREPSNDREYWTNVFENYRRRK